MRGSRRQLFLRLTNKTMTDADNYTDSSLLHLMSYILHNQMS